MMNRVLKKILILLVRFYQGAISPLFPPVCRFQPTCSNYMIQAIEEWGPWRGGWMGLRRISRCHPWGGHGHDPVPPNPKKAKATAHVNQTTSQSQ